MSASGYAAGCSSGGMTSGERLSGPSTEEAHRERSRWMSLGGAIVSGWFLIVILAMEIPHLMLKECR